MTNFPQLEDRATPPPSTVVRVPRADDSAPLPFHSPARGGIAVPLIALFLEQYVQLRYGFVAAVGLALLTIGVKAENATCAGIGGILLITPAISAGS
ncbi:hypothetical protein [Streptomyces sp. NBC_00467]|uniref:hypothetical protein n=1 Tax=Streptomyces sp. NBC_00467 TaxID=2975752 RepID=UPI002E185AA5